jgi:hypothetical protein
MLFYIAWLNGPGSTDVYFKYTFLGMAGNAALKTAV